MPTKSRKPQPMKSFNTGGALTAQRGAAPKREGAPINQAPKAGVPAGQPKTPGYRYGGKPKGKPKSMF